MLGNIFYFVGLFILICSFSNLINFFKFSKIRHWILTYQKVTGKEINRKDFKSVEEYNIFTIFSLFILSEFVWFTVGLVSSSWYVFLILISTSLFIRLLSRSLNFNVISITLGFFNQLFKFLTILFLILNHFHFHIDLISLF
jgi:hypothetical protein